MDAAIGARLARCAMTVLFRWRVRRVVRGRIATTPRRERSTLLVLVGAAAERALALSGLPDRFGVKSSSADLDDPVAGVHTDEARQRLRGWAVVIGSMSATVSPALAVVVMVLGWNMQHVVDAGPKRRRADVVAEQLLLAVDLMAISVRAGSTIGRALDVVSARVPDPVGHALADVGRRTRLGVRFAESVAELGDELGPTAAPLVGVLRAAHLDGDPLAPALERLAATLREVRRHHHESEARRLSVRLLLPLVGCLLPAFALISVVPVLVDSLSRIPR